MNKELRQEVDELRRAVIETAFKAGYEAGSDDVMKQERGTYLDLEKGPDGVDQHLKEYLENL